MQHFFFSTNKNGMLHMKNILTHFDKILKGDLKKKITAQALKRMAIIFLFLLKFKVKEISSIIKCSEKTVRKTIKKFKAHGILNLLEKPRSGRKSRLNSQEIIELKKKINLQNSQESQSKIVHVAIINDIIN